MYTHTNRHTYIYRICRNAGVMVGAAAAILYYYMKRTRRERCMYFYTKGVHIATRENGPAFLMIIGLPYQPWSTHLDFYMTDKKNNFEGQP